MYFSRLELVKELITVKQNIVLLNYPKNQGVNTLMNLLKLYYKKNPEPKIQSLINRYLFIDN
jgi:hypothetical protein